MQHSTSCPVAVTCWDKLSKMDTALFFMQQSICIVYDYLNSKQIETFEGRYLEGSRREEQQSSLH